MTGVVSKDNVCVVPQGLPVNYTVGRVDSFGDPDKRPHPLVNGAPKRRRSLVREESTHLVSARFHLHKSHIAFFFAIPAR